MKWIKSNIAFNTMWMFADKIYGMGLSLLVGVWIARYLGPENYGIFGYATAFTAIFVTLGSLGINGLIVKDFISNQYNQSTILGSVAAIQFAGGIMALLLCLTLNSYLNSTNEMAYLLTSILSLQTIFRSFEVLKYWFESQVQYKYIVWAENFALTISAVLKLAIVFNNGTLVDLAYVFVLESFAIVVFTIFIYIHSNGDIKSWRLNLVYISQVVKNGWWLTGTSTMYVIYQKIDQILLGHFLSGDSLGVYIAALRISEMWYFIPSAIVFSLFPELMRTRSSSAQVYLFKIQQLYSFVFYLSIMILVFIYFASESIVYLLYGYKFKEAANLLTIQAITGIFVSMSWITGRWMISENLQSLLLPFTFVGLVFNLVLNLVVIPIYGNIGAAYSALATQIFIFLIHLWHAKTRANATAMLKSPMLIFKIKRV